MNNNTAKKRGKVSVPRNEYDAALATLTNIFDSRSNSSNDHTAIFTKEHNYTTNKGKEEEIKSSILTTFQSTVEAIDTVEFEKLQRYDTPMKKQIKRIIELENIARNFKEDSDTDAIQKIVDDISVSSCSSDDHDNSSQDDSSDDDDDDESIMDEEDLIDEDVLNKAKEYRAKIRHASMQLNETRSRKLDEALECIRVHLDKVVKIEQAFMADGDSSSSILEADTLKKGAAGLDSDEKDGSNDTLDANVDIDLRAMEGCLVKLKSQLDAIGSELPDKVQSLKDTIETVSKSIRKKMDGKLSATEKAIRSRETDSVWKRRGAGGGKQHANSEAFLGTFANGNHEGKMDAAKRFALFLSNA